MKTITIRVELLFILLLFASCAKTQIKILGIKKQNLPVAYGNVYSKSSWANTSDFIANGATVALSGSNLKLSGGSSATDFTKSADYNYYSGLDVWTVNAKAKVLAVSSTTYGFGVGLRSTGTFGSPLSLVAKLNLSTDANAGKVTIHTTITGGSLTTAATSPALVFAAGDSVSLTLSLNQGVVTATATNLATGASVTASYTYSLTTASTTGHLPNCGRYALFSFGGSYDITAFSATTSAYKYAPLMCIGDSKTRAYNATTFANRYFNKLQTISPYAVLDAGGNDRTIDVLNKLPEIIAFHPAIIVLNIGSNDKRSGVTFATWSANYASIVTQLQAAGITVYHLLQFNENSLDFSDYNSYITSNYPANRIINAGVISISSDGVHPDDAGNNTIYNAIKSALNL